MKDDRRRFGHFLQRYLVGDYDCFGVASPALLSTSLLCSAALTSHFYVPFLSLTGT